MTRPIAAAHGFSVSGGVVNPAPLWQRALDRRATEHVVWRRNPNGTGSAHAFLGSLALCHIANSGSRPVAYVACDVGPHGQPYGRSCSLCCSAVCGLAKGLRRVGRAAGISL